MCGIARVTTGDGALGRCAVTGVTGRKTDPEESAAFPEKSREADGPWIEDELAATCLRRVTSGLQASHNHDS
jgi:hypothetical protein